MLCSAVNNYISSVKGLPFFYVVGDGEYISTLEELKQSGLSVVRVSDFCSKDDKYPNIDNIADYFRTADVDYRENKYVLIGLGEYLALRGSDEVEKVLARFSHTTLGNARVVLLLRCVTPQVTQMMSSDHRIEASQRAYISPDTSFDISIVNTQKSLEKGCVGMKALLHKIEDGACSSITVHTDLSLDNSLLPISTIADSYSALTHEITGFTLKKEYGSNEMWDAFLSDVMKSNKSISTVFDKYDLLDDYEQDIYEKVSGYEYKNWLYFLSLKANIEKISNPYLKYVVSNVSSFVNLKNILLTEIVNIPHTDKDYCKLYSARKKLLKDFPESDIAVFLNENSINPKESIYRFTDNTSAERMAIIKWLSQNQTKVPLEEIYPALNIYLKKYIFDCGPLSEQLTTYFDEYKKQKLLSTTDVSDDFLQLVTTHAQNHTYTHLPTRDNAIKSIKNKESTFLYWIDALGVEYLSYITELVHKKGLSSNVEITRVDLPTITSQNNQFYEQWQGAKYKEERLDSIKHKDNGGFIFSEKSPEPTYLSSELNIIEDAINCAAAKLAMHECKSFVIASDHGASRLAVIHNQEEKYDTDTKGEHSGRCCKTFSGCDLPYVIEENDFLTLSDYGRFKGSRKANVEVHGGASLEEVIVPIITLTLRNNSSVEIRVLDKDEIHPDRHLGTTVKLYISYVETTDNVSLVINGTSYKASCDDRNHYTIVLSNIKRSKQLSADVYDGSNLIGNVTIAVKGKVASSDTEFGNDLF